MTPDVSVVIPTYNRSRYITAAIDSVLGQTLGGVEIIVADDGSTDDTADKVKAYGDRVRYVRTSNGGCSHARNVGTAVARGRYLAYLDSDDLYYPHALEMEKTLLDRHPEVGMVYAEMSGFDDDGFFDRYHLKTYHESAYRDPDVTYEHMFARSVSLADAGVLPDALLEQDPSLGWRRAYFGNIFDWYLTATVLFTNNVMLRREVVSAAGARNEQLKYWEEFDYTLRISRTQTVCFLDVPTYKLRYHPGQISTTARADGKYVWLRKQQILLRVVKRHALADREYYRRHRARIDGHIAHLHRAAAVPMMVSERAPSGRSAYAERARLYLDRCRRLGHPEWILWLLTFLPRPARRVGVGAVERLRKVARQHRVLLPAAIVTIAALLLLENLGARQLDRVLLYLPGVDKLLHVGQSFLIVQMLYWLAGATGLSTRMRLAVAVACALSLAGFDEVQQKWMASGRHVDAGDVLASAGGILLAAAGVARRSMPARAAVMAVVALVGSGVVAYSSYATTKDYNRGLLAEEQGRLGEAHRHFSRARDAGMSGADLYNALAWTAAESDGVDPAVAVAYAEQSLALRPSDPDTLDTYGWTLYRAGRARDALMPLQQALQQKPGIYCIHYHLAMTYLALGDTEAGRRHLRLQLAQAPPAAESRRAAEMLKKLDEAAPGTLGAGS